ncbi:MFS transporter [Nonomuraea soli]
MVLLDTTILGVALPDLRRDFGSGTAALGWVVNGYTVAFAAALIGGGAVADRFGPGRVFRYGTAAFAAVSGLCAAAPSLEVLVVSRAVLGLAGAVMVPASLAIISRLIPAGPERVRMLGVWAMTAGVSVAAGPLLGGGLVELAGWRATFLVNVPIGLVTWWLVRGVRLPASPVRVRWVPQVGAAVLVACLAEAITGRSVIALGVGVVVLAWLAGSQRTAFSILGEAGLVRWFVVGGAVQFLFAGLLFVGALVLQEARMLTPVETGVAFLPLTVPIMVLPLFTTRVRRAMVIGVPLLVVGAAVLAAAGERASVLPAVGLFVVGVGIAFTFPPLVAAVTSAVPAARAGEAGGMLNASRQVGAALGVASMGSLPPGWAFVLAGAVVLAVVPLVAPRRVRVA